MNGKLLKKKVLCLLVVILLFFSQFWGTAFVGSSASFVGQHSWDAFASSLPFTDRFVDPQER